jgi:transposase-like protein
MASRERRRKQWEKRIACWRTSGLSMAAYCREHEVNYGQLVWWRRCLQRDVTLPPLTLIPVLVPATSRSVIVVRLSSGVGIEVECGFDAGLLSAVVRALQVTVPC